jgi:hypothetical protein
VYGGGENRGMPTPNLDRLAAEGMQFLSFYAIKGLMQTYLTYPPRKLQSAGYAGPVTITQYQRFQPIREQLAQEGFNIGLPTGD